MDGLLIDSGILKWRFRWDLISWGLQAGTRCTLGQQEALQVAKMVANTGGLFILPVTLTTVHAGEVADGF
jgi:hypothetical protein